MELSQAHRLSYHHFKYLIHHHLVILELSGETGCPSCYTGSYFPLLVVEMTVFSQIYYSLHYLDEGYLFALLVIVSVILAKMSLQRSLTFGVLTVSLHMILQ